MVPCNIITLTPSPFSLYWAPSSPPTQSSSPSQSLWLIQIEIWKGWCTADTALALRQRATLWRRADARNVRLYYLYPAVHQPFHISICISTLPTQHTTFMAYVHSQGRNEKTELRPTLTIQHFWILNFVCKTKNYTHSFSLGRNGGRCQHNLVRATVRSFPFLPLWNRLSSCSSLDWPNL